MLWMIATAAVAAAISLVHLGALSVWVTVLSLALRAAALLLVSVLIGLIGTLAWRRRPKPDSDSSPHA